MGAEGDPGEEEADLQESIPALGPWGMQASGK